LEVDDDTDPYKEYDAAKLEEYLKNSLELEHANNSGKVPHYSNLAVALLGQSLSQSQNKDFAELLNEYVFKKYGMKHSYTSPDQAAKHLCLHLMPKEKKSPPGHLIPFYLRAAYSLQLQI
jgi:Beta-lactamase class C and other penicillin binding proteins